MPGDTLLRGVAIAAMLTALAACSNPPPQGAPPSAALQQAYERATDPKNR